MPIGLSPQLKLGMGVCAGLLAGVASAFLAEVLRPK